jgi:hypothetical protein
MWEFGSTNYADDHGDVVSTEPSSKELTKHGGLDDAGEAWPLGTIKARYSDPQITQQPLLSKYDRFHPNSWSVQISEFVRTGKKSRVIFDPANLVLLSLHLHWR